MPTIEGAFAQSRRARARVGCEARLAYDGEKTALEFLTMAFGLQERTRMQGADDSFMAWLELGRSTLMIGRSGPERHNLYSPRQRASPRPK